MHLIKEFNQTPSPNTPRDFPIPPFYVDAIGLFFGLQADYLQQWPGIGVYFAYLETQFLRMLEYQRAILEEDTLFHVSNESSLGWEWCFAVLRAFQELESESIHIRNISLSNVLERMQRMRQGEPERKKHSGAQKEEHGWRIIFNVLCWLSMTLKPIFPDQRHMVIGSEQHNIDLWIDGSSKVLSSHTLRRPVTKVFRLFRKDGDEEQIPSLSQPYSSAMSSIESSGILYQSSLDFFSLHNIGHIELEWVDTITAHLQFNHYKRKLSIFRFPSMCAVSIAGEAPTIIKSITEEILPCEFWPELFRPEDSKSIHREILLSYRLLFAQSAKSRRLIQRCLMRLSREEEIDPFLTSLCTAPLKSFNKCSLASSAFPFSALDENGDLQESDSYSVREDFPFFGSRLLTIQRYNMRRQPSKIKDLWRDRRNPLQWYTFWAVLWVGGISIILSILQLAVGIGQLYFSSL